MLSYFQVILGILFCVSNRRVCLIYRSYFGSVSCVIPVRRVVCSSRGCLRTWGPTLWCWTCCRSPMRRWVAARQADLCNSFFNILFNDLSFYLCGSASTQSDEKMNEIMTLAHTFLQNFCRGNPQNQALLHKHLNLFLTPGVY